jgi:hypothetical protein
MARRKAAAENTRGPHFPYYYKLEKLLSSFDPAIGPFQVEMFRRNARDLRKWLCGPEAIGDAPPGAGLRVIKLPKGWELWLAYEEPPGFREPGKVTALFRPPKEEGAPEERSCSAEEPTIDAEGKPQAETPALVEAPGALA